MVTERHSWGEKGEKLEVKVNMSSEYKKVFGAIDIETGKFYYQIKSVRNNAKLEKRKWRSFFRLSKIFSKRV